jgi:hypothetical protein
MRRKRKRSKDEEETGTKSQNEEADDEESAVGDQKWIIRGPDPRPHPLPHPVPSSFFTLLFPFLLTSSTSTPHSPGFAYLLPKNRLRGAYKLESFWGVAVLCRQEISKARGMGSGSGGRESKREEESKEGRRRG